MKCLCITRSTMYMYVMAQPAGDGNTPSSMSKYYAFMLNCSALPLCVLVCVLYNVLYIHVIYIMYMYVHVQYILQHIYDNKSLSVCVCVRFKSPPAPTSPPSCNGYLEYFT